MEIRSVTRPEPAGASLIVGVLAGNTAAPGSEQALESVDPRLLAAAKFEGKPGQVLVAPGEEAEHLVLVGLGEEVGYETLRAALGNAVRAVRTERAVTELHRLDVEGAVRAVVEGAGLGSYQYRVYKTDPEPLEFRTLDLPGADPEQVGRALVAVEATNLARDWVNTPAKDKAPVALAEMIGAVAGEAGVETEIWDEARITEERLGALLAVAAGSDRPPRLVVLQYRPPGATHHLGLVGKGITFDTGGLSIKAANFMEEMKDDMGGAAAVAAATVAIARLGLGIGVTTVVPLTDNAVGGDATRPGDVIRPVEGPTIEVLNTDAEGRLILADGLGVVRRYQPDLIVDVATLTGAARTALGDKIAGVFGSDRETAALVLTAGSRAGENHWELPLFTEYKKMLESDVADLKNVTGSRYGGAIAAALFLSHYAGEGPWAHVDMAGPARSRETNGEQVKGGSGFGVRTLIELARGLVEPV